MRALGTASILLLCVAARAASTPTPALGPELEAIRRRAEVPTLGAELLQRGRVVDAAVAGVRKWGNPVASQVGDRFHLGSCTKAMTATLAAILVEKGMLRWGAPLGELVADPAALDPAYRAVKFETLFAHRAGLTGDLAGLMGGTLHDRLRDPALAPVDARAFVARTVLAAPPSVAPESRYLYSNAGYIVAGHLLERLAGRSWERLMVEELFGPLGMGSCGFGPPGDPAAPAPDQPWPHDVSAQGPVPRAPGPDSDNPPAYGPAGGVHCSMADWGKFLAFHVDGFNRRPTPRLRPASFDQLHRAYPGQEYTFGGWLRGTRGWAGGTVLTHSGSNSLNFVQTWLAPAHDRVYLSVANQGSPAALGAVDAAIAQLIRMHPR